MAVLALFGCHWATGKHDFKEATWEQLNSQIYSVNRKINKGKKEKSNRKSIILHSFQFQKTNIQSKWNTIYNNIQVNTTGTHSMPRADQADRKSAAIGNFQTTNNFHIYLLDNQQCICIYCITMQCPPLHNRSCNPAYKVFTSQQKGSSVSTTRNWHGDEKGYTSNNPNYNKKINKIKNLMKRKSLLIIQNKHLGPQWWALQPAAESDSHFSSRFAPSTPNMQETNTSWKNQTSF